MDIHSIGGGAPSAPPIADKPPGATAIPAVTRQNATAAQTVDAVTKAARAPSTEEVAKAVQDINRTIQAMSQNLEFSVDAHNQNVVVKVVDQQTKEVLRQIPSEEAIEIAKSLGKLQGLLIKQQA